MKKIKLVLDSACDADEGDFEGIDCEILPIKVICGDKEYEDGVDLLKRDYYSKLKQVKEIPKTSQVNFDRFEKCYMQATKEGKQVLVLTMSGAMSGTYNSARLAGEGFSNVRVVDSFQVTAPFFALAIEAKKLILQGKNIEEIIQELEILRSKVKILGTVGSLEYLIKGGRVSKTMGIVGNLVGIKPLVTIGDSHTFEVWKKALGLNAGISACITQLQKCEIDKTKPIYITHSDAEDLADKLKMSLIEKTGYVPDNKLVEFGPTVATHAGPNCVGVVFFTK